MKKCRMQQTLMEKINAWQIFELCVEKVAIHGWNTDLATLFHMGS